MKRSTVIIIVAICLIVAGIASVCAGFVMADFSWNGFSSEKFEEVTHTVDGNFDHLLIATDIHNITLAPSSDQSCRIVGSESRNFKIEYEIEGNTLVVKAVDERQWYEYIGMFLGEAEMTLYLPKTAYISLTAASDTGDIIIPESFSFTGASMATSTGAIVFGAAVEQELALASDTGSISVSKQKLSRLDVEVSTGKITLENIEAENDVRAKASTGRVELHDIKCNSLNAEASTGSITLKNVIAENKIKVKASTGRVTLTSCLSNSLNIETSTGDVNLYASDAENIEIDTDTGNVEGSILTSKIFTTETDTGRVRVPQSTEGGTCKIRTDTGDITITIE